MYPRASRNHASGSAKCGHGARLQPESPSPSLGTEPPSKFLGTSHADGAGRTRQHRSSSPEGRCLATPWFVRPAERPIGLTVDSTDQVPVAESENHTIRSILPAGVVTTLAGMAGAPGAVDGVWTSAQFRLPTAPALADSGTIRVADSGKHAVRASDATRRVTTFAGVLGRPGTADGTAALLTDLFCIAVNARGTVFVGDWDNHAVRRIPGGNTTTIVSIAGVDRLLPGPLPGQLRAVTGIAAPAPGMLIPTTPHAVLRAIGPF